MGVWSDVAAHARFMLELHGALAQTVSLQEGRMIYRQAIKISVVVPLFNAEPYVARCAEALLAQDYPASAYEIIMVDNNSTDASVRVVQHYSRIRLLSERKQGAYAARNQALCHADGTIVAFTDPDCVPDCDWLTTIAAGMADPAAGILVGSHQFPSHSFALSALEAYENAKKAFVLNGTRSELYYGHANNLAIRRRLLDELGTFVERDRGSDTILIQRCLERYSVAAVRFCPDMRVCHLEIDSVGAYYHKCAIYGGSRQGYGQIAHFRPLNMWGRWAVYRWTVRRQRYSWIQALWLLGLLGVGFLHWVSGGMAAVYRGENTR